jgi:hypothetical protein
MPDRLGRQIQEHPEALLPLIEQLLPVNDNQSADLAFRDQPRRNGGFAERRRSAEDVDFFQVNKMSGEPKGILAIRLGRSRRK